MTTLVTSGLSDVDYSMWRGLPLGFELLLTTMGDVSHAAADLYAVAREHGQRKTTGRRAIIEANGVWAPGYPPHMFFTDQVSATPELIHEEKKLGDRYVTFTSAIQIDDRELRLYDRNPLELIATLNDPLLVATYPRPPQN